MIFTGPLLLFKNKKDGRVTNPDSWMPQFFLIGKTINDYKGTNKAIFRLLRVKGIITEEQTKLLEELEKKERGSWNNPTQSQPDIPQVPQPTPTNNPPREQEQTNKREELTTQKLQINQEITTALNQEPQLANSELSASYQHWAGRIESENDPNQLNTLKEQILADIQTKRNQKKVAVQELKDNLTKAQTGTPEQKAQVLEKLEKNEGQRVYEDQKSVITQLKVAQATKNPHEYSEKLIQKLANKLAEQEVSETDLSSENKEQYAKLKAGTITDPTQLVAVETSITKNIYQVKVTKELTNLITETTTALNTNNKGHIEQIKSKLLAFISNSNIYYSEVHKTEARKSLAKLENHVITNNTNNNLSLSTKIAIGLGVGLLTLGIILVLKRKKKLSLRKK